jgi:hypothetical protein
VGNAAMGIFKYAALPVVDAYISMHCLSEKIADYFMRQE